LLQVSKINEIYASTLVKYGKRLAWIKNHVLRLMIDID